MNINRYTQNTAVPPIDLLSQKQTGEGHTARVLAADIVGAPGNSRYFRRGA